MKATVLQKYWIMCRSLWATLKLSLIILLKNSFGHLSRKVVDRLSHRWAVDVLNIAKVTYRVVGCDRFQFDPHRCYIVMSNHASHYDIPLMMAAFPEGLRMMTKRELYKIPIWGHAMKISEIVPIDRGDAKRALSNLKYAKEKLKSGVRLWVAPEGTRTRSGKLGEFKKGGFLLAKQTKAIIIPVGIRGSGNILPPKTWDFYLNQKVEVHIGKPIDTASYASSQRQQLMDDVKDAIQSLIIN